MKSVFVKKFYRKKFPSPSPDGQEEPHLPDSVKVVPASLTCNVRLGYDRK